MSGRLKRVRGADRWIAWVRLGAIPFAIFQVAISGGYPPGYKTWAWVTTVLFIVGAAALFWLAHREDARPARISLPFLTLPFLTLLFDSAVICSYVLAYSFEVGTPIRQLLFLPVVEGALLYGMTGAFAAAIGTAPVVGIFEWLRSNRLSLHSYQTSYVTFQLGTQVIMALIVGWLVNRLGTQTGLAEARAAEAERLQDELGRRTDVLEAANRCARALNSSLELDQAFTAFIRELRGLMRFDRMAIVMAEGGEAQVMAVSGEGADHVLPAGSSQPVAPSLLGDLIVSSETIYRRDMSDARYPEEEEFLALGLRCRVAAPLLQGARAVGMLSLVRRDPDSFNASERELAALLGRLVASAVQNIRAYEAERKTVEELRRLSALRADFVSLVSHELRTPMASVIGSARTLQQRWRELSPDQRESFLALIGDETTRLAALIGDVLDTSRIEAGTFSYTFADVDMADLVRESAAAGNVGQDEVKVLAEVHDPLPAMRGDRERLRQVLMNLIENAIKYSPTGGVVDVRAYAYDGQIRIDVSDHGPGIAREDQKLIFEKFGRVHPGGVGKPGTGLGLFISRSIAEAHGGSLDVRSSPERGALFTLALPVEPGQ